MPKEKNKKINKNGGNIPPTERIIKSSAEHQQNELEVKLNIGKQIESIFNPAIQAKTFTEGNPLSHILFASPYSVQLDTEFEFTKDDLQTILQNVTPEERPIIAEIFKNVFNVKDPVFGEQDNKSPKKQKQNTNNKVLAPMTINYQEMMDFAARAIKNDKISQKLSLSICSVMSDKLAQKQKQRSDTASTMNWITFGLGLASTGLTLAGFLMENAPAGVKIAGLVLMGIFALLTIVQRSVNMIDRVKNQNNFKILEQALKEKQKVFEKMNEKLQAVANKNNVTLPIPLIPEMSKDKTNALPIPMPFKIDNKKENLPTIHSEHADVKEEETKKTPSNPFANMFANLFKQKQDPNKEQKNETNTKQSPTATANNDKPPIANLFGGMPPMGKMPPFMGMPPMGMTPVNKPPMPTMPNGGMPPMGKMPPFMGMPPAPNNKTNDPNASKNLSGKQAKDGEIKSLLDELRSAQGELNKLQNQKQELTKQINNSTDILQGLPGMMKNLQ